MKYALLLCVALALSGCDLVASAALQATGNALLQVF
jgi:hypothetical protein